MNVICIPAIVAVVAANWRNNPPSCHSGNANLQQEFSLTLEEVFVLPSENDFCPLSL